MGERRSLLRRSPTFRRFWIAGSVSEVGDRISDLALPLIATTTLSASAVEVSALTALLWTPALLALWIGSWVDHQPNRRRILVVADLVRAAVLLSLPIAYACDALTIGQLYAVALVTGLAQTFFRTATTAVFVGLVDREDFVEAHSNVNLSRSVSFGVGPALAGGIVQAISAPGAVIVDSVSFLGSAALLRGVPADVGAQQEDEEPPKLLDGLRFIRDNGVLRASLAMCAVVNLFSFVWLGLTVVFAIRTLHLSPGLLGLALGIGSVGGVLGAASAGRISGRFGLGPSAIVGTALYAAPTLFLASAHGPTWLQMLGIIAFELIGGIGVMLLDVPLGAIMSAVIPPHLRASVSGAYISINYGTRPIGALLGGALASAIGIREALYVAAVGGTLSIVFGIFSPLRKVRTVEDCGPPSPTGAGPLVDQPTG